MEKQIYFVRHGESEENVSHVHIGSGAHLTEQGTEQAKILAERMSRIGIDALISSPFTRAMETAVPIAAATGVPLQTDAAFGEWLEPSEVFGLHVEHPVRKSIRDAIRSAVDDHAYRHSDEESFTELRARGEAALHSLAVHESARICVVTHGGFLRILVGTMLLGSSFTKEEFVRLLNHFVTRNTGVTSALYDEVHGWRIVTLNDQSHLG